MKVFSETHPKVITEPTVEYQVVWFRQGAPVIRLSLFTTPEDEQALHQYKDLLWEIADSFEFID